MSLVMAICTVQASGTSIHLTARSGPYVGWNRDKIVEDAVNAGTDYLMMIDTDLVFPEHAILTLISRQKDIIGGLYMMKMLPPAHTIKHGEFDPATNEYTEGPQNWTPPAEPFRCAAVATGFLLIRMEAIADLSRPLFPTVRPVGEDMAFCENAKAHGLEIWCDPTFHIEHLGDYRY